MKTLGILWKIEETIKIVWRVEPFKISVIGCPTLLSSNFVKGLPNQLCLFSPFPLELFSNLSADRTVLLEVLGKGRGLNGDKRGQMKEFWWIYQYITLPMALWCIFINQVWFWNSFYQFLDPSSLFWSAWFHDQSFIIEIMIILFLWSPPPRAGQLSWRLAGSSLLKLQLIFKYIKIIFNISLKLIVKMFTNIQMIKIETA